MESQKWNIFRISGLSSLPPSPQEQRYKSPQSPADQTPSHSLCGAGPAATPGAALLPTAWFPVEPEWGVGQVGTRPVSSLRGLGGGEDFEVVVLIYETCLGIWLLTAVVLTQ